MLVTIQKSIRLNIGYRTVGRNLNRSVANKKKTFTDLMGLLPKCFLLKLIILRIILV